MQWITITERTRPQADVIRRAAELGGTIDRAEVYEVSGFDEDRLLTGFTKPIALHPVYDGPGKARAFEVPDEVVDLLRSSELDPEI